MSYLARIYVTPRADVLDPQGTAVGNALHSLGFDEVGDVRVGRYLEMELSGQDPAAAESRLAVESAAASYYAAAAPSRSRRGAPRHGPARPRSEG